MSTSKCPSLPTGQEKPCIVSYHTQNDRMNEPPPQPRVRKVTTIVNTLGIVVRHTSTEIRVWVFTACVEKTIPKTNQHMFMTFQLGTYVVIGLHPDSTIASFSPWTMLLHAFETRVVNGEVLIKRLTSELEFVKTVNSGDQDFSNPLLHEQGGNTKTDIYKISGLGCAMAGTLNRTFFAEMKDNCSIWLRYSEDFSKGCSWIISDLEFLGPPDFSEKELCDISEFVREKQCQNEAIPCPSKSVARHFGLITGSSNNMPDLSCWSPNVSMESDHSAKIPQLPKHKENQGSLLRPLIGQWIQYDIQPKNGEIILKTRPGYKLNIQEYLPINSPCGIGVVVTNQTIRVMVSCILVKSTDHPRIYDLPLFGYVIDHKSSLVSGSHMQLVLEKTQPNQRSSSGICWRVIDSCIVDVTDVKIEKVTELGIELVSSRDSMEVSHFAPIEKSAPITQSKMTSIPSFGFNTSNSGITTLKYQPFSHQNYSEQRREYYLTGNSVQLPSNYPMSRNNRSQSRKWLDKVEGPAIVERVLPNNKSVILWCFNQSTSVNALFDEFEFEIGDYIYIKAEKGMDSTGAFKWFWKCGTKIAPPFKCYVEKNQVMIEEQIQFGGIDGLKRNFYHSKHFLNILDLDGKIQNPSVDVSYSVTLCRRKIQNNATPPITRFQWIIHSTHNNTSRKSGLFIPSGNYRSYSNRQTLLPISTPSENSRSTKTSDHSAKSATTDNTVATI